MIRGSIEAALCTGVLVEIWLSCGAPFATRKLVQEELLPTFRCQINDNEKKPAFTKVLGLHKRTVI